MEYNLERFIEAQAHNYTEALIEISIGRKTSHWMWYVFPQIIGLGFSEMSRKYAIQNMQEADFYLSHELLGKRLVAVCEVLLKVECKTIYEILGSPDDIKLKSCMTLFSLASNTHPIFEEMLEKYFQGERCLRTLKILQEA